MDKKAELDNSIIWFEHLKEVVEAGDYETALEAIQAAIDLLTRQREGL